MATPPWQWTANNPEEVPPFRFNIIIQSELQPPFNTFNFPKLLESKSDIFLVFYGKCPCVPLCLCLCYDKTYFHHFQLMCKTTPFTSLDKTPFGCFQSVFQEGFQDRSRNVSTQLNSATHLYTICLQPFSSSFFHWYNFLSCFVVPALYI